MRIYGYDYKKANCNTSDFDFKALGYIILSTVLM